MSSLYLDIIKDRLYTAPPASPERRGAQTVLYDILDGLLRLMAPILSFTVAETWEYLPALSNPEGRESSAFCGLFPPENDAALDEKLEAKWKRLLSVRAEVTKALEIARRNKVIGHPLEAEVKISVSGDLADFLKDEWVTLKRISIVSDLEQVDEPGEDAYHSEDLPELKIMVGPAAGEKCERCWLRVETVGQDAGHPQICDRCSSVVAQL